MSIRQSESLWVRLSQSNAWGKNGHRKVESFLKVMTDKIARCQTYSTNYFAEVAYGVQNYVAGKIICRLFHALLRYIEQTSFR